MGKLSQRRRPDWVNLTQPSVEEDYIAREDIEKICDATREFFAKLFGQKTFDIWAESIILPKRTVRQLAINFHMSRYNIRKRIRSINNFIKRNKLFV